MRGLCDWVWRHGASIAAVMTPGLALWLPSGYSWGPVWLLLCALGGAGERVQLRFLG